MKKEYKREFYLKNRGKYSESSRLRYLENRTEILEKRRTTRSNESDIERKERLSYLKSWKIKNPDYSRNYMKDDKARYNYYYKNNSKRRGYEFALTLDDFQKIFHQDCAYCGKEDACVIDRVDNSKGYLLENCVSCCGVCNKMKWRFTKDEFLNQVKLIYNKLLN